MKNVLLDVLPVVAALGSALMAGLFFAFSTTVMKTLGGLPHAQGITAMQSINRTIVNPLFLLVFVGTALVCAVTAVSAVVWWSEPGAVAVFVGSLLYFLGGFLMTAVVHIPWNNALDAVDPNGAGAADHWRGYVRKWTTWNHLRGLASLGAVAAFILSRG